ncbi:DEKNAAC103420 [Brettanomyces naardenensis]|uniref:DEKNAAC103420 n=1 Tax=Brettanomyces naardenensis TaxID=13370 RepID=A0A448YNS2_BRENA|nr:DEKNAAC103420 [Brettanomyces naardenensis]
MSDKEVKDELKAVESVSEEKNVGTSEPVGEGAAEPTTQSTTLPSTLSDAPPMPKRPVSPTERAIKELKDAFPDLEDKYIKMALIASQGQLDPAFNALLYLSDPTSDIPIPVPQAESAKSTPTSAAKDSTRKQLEADEALARKLARQYEGGSRRKSHTNGHPQLPKDKSNVPAWAKKGDDNDQLEEFYDNLSKNVENVRTKLGGWVEGLAKRINAEVDDSDGSRQNQQYSSESPNLPQRRKPQLFNAFGSNTNSAADYGPPVPPKDDTADRLADRFSPIQLSDDTEDIYGTPRGPRVEEKSKQTLLKEKNSSQADVAAKPEEAKDSNWKRLSNVEPEPVSNDTFQVDDSEEEESPKKE